MVARRPKVDVDGDEQELPQGDTLDVPLQASMLAVVSRSHDTNVTLTDATPTAIAWSTERIALDPNYFATATDDDVEVKKTQAYEIVVNAVATPSSASDATAHLRLYINGSIVTGLESDVGATDTGADATPTISTVLELTAGQRIGPRFHRTGSNITLQADSLTFTIKALDASAGDTPVIGTIICAPVGGDQVERAFSGAVLRHSRALMLKSIRATLPKLLASGTLTFKLRQGVTLAALADVAEAIVTITGAASEGFTDFPDVAYVANNYLVVECIAASQVWDSATLVEKTVTITLDCELS